MANLVRLSKFLSLMLRHKADEFNLTLDSDGFTSLDSVWKEVQKRYPDEYTHADLNNLVAQGTDGKQRFEVKHGRIRALYGHSDVGEIIYPAVEPPEILYHGTTSEALISIRQQGLNAQQRQYVHLSTNTDRATNVAGRHGKPLILIVRAKAAHDAGYVFHHPEPQHYLVKTVSIEFIDFSDE